MNSFNTARARFVKTMPLLVWVTLISGCGFIYMGPEDTPDTAGIELAKRLEARQEIQLKNMRRAARSVYIHAYDIELPLEPGQGQPPETKEYVFEVWAHMDPRQTSEDLLQIEILGAKARIEEADYGSSSEPRKSQAVHRIVVRSDEVKQNITIMAWYPKAYANHEKERTATIRDLQGRIKTLQRGTDDENDSEKKKLFVALQEVIDAPNPFGEVRVVRVLDGNLHTRVVMLSRAEIQQAFGHMFAKYFYVGRAYFANKHSDKDLVVNTTSLQARCLFYRSPNERLSKEFLEKDGADLSRYDYLLRIGAAGSEVAGFRTSTGLSTAQVKRIIRTAGEYLLEISKDSANSVSSVLKELKGETILESQSGEARTIVEDAYKLLYPKYEEFVNEIVTDPNKATVQRNLANTAWKAAMQRDEGTSWDQFWRAESVKNVSQDARPRLEQILRDVDHAITGRAIEIVGVASPLEWDLSLRAGPTRKRVALSDDLEQQGRLSALGYLFEDYYRPMTFAAVLVSLIEITENHPVNFTLRLIESLGVAAGALVGAAPLTGLFAKAVYGTSVALTTGVFIPELRKLLYQEVEPYIKNLGTLALDTVLTIPPAGSRDGYVFFPKGPIFGFGVDEFSVDEPSFIVNIDNTDVSVDGLLVTGGTRVSSGYKDSSTLTQEAVTQGNETRAQREKDLQKLQASLRDYRLATIESDVRKMIECKDYSGADSILAEFEKLYGVDQSGTISRLRSELSAQMNLSALVFLGAKNQPDFSRVKFAPVIGKPGEYTCTYYVRLSREITVDSDAYITVHQLEAPAYSVEAKLLTPGSGGTRSASVVVKRDEWHTLYEVTATLILKDASSPPPEEVALTHHVACADPGLTGSVIHRIKVSK